MPGGANWSLGGPSEEFEEFIILLIIILCGICIGIGLPIIFWDNFCRPGGSARRRRGTRTRPQPQWVTVPEGVGAGMQITARWPDGQTAVVTVPDGVTVGQQLEVPEVQIQGLQVGDRVEVRDVGLRKHKNEQLWEAGVVAELLESGRPKVKKDGWQEAFKWDEVRAVQTQPEPEPEPEPEPGQIPEEGVPPAQP